MISWQLTKKSIFSFLLVSFLVLSNHCAEEAYAQEDKSAIILYNRNIEISYHQPYRNSYKSNHPSYIEVPKLNHILNLFQNYIEYLKKLNRLTGEPKLRISYAPDQQLDESPNPRERIIRIKDLGLVNLLQKVNEHFINFDLAKENNLLVDPEALYSIPDSDITKDNLFTKSKYWENVSKLIPSLEPDTDFAVIDDSTILTVRPGKKTNLIYKLDWNEGESGIISEEAKTWYNDMLPSDDGKYVILVDGLQPLVINIETKEVTYLFPDKEVALLESDWSPTKNIVAGMILDEKTDQRHCFIYDAEAKTMLTPGDFHNNLQENYLYPFPYWSPKGNKIVYLSAKGVHYIDLAKNTSKADLVKTENEIAEFLWSEDENSFAFIEVKGQPRDQYRFDDFDYRGSTLHRYRFNDTSMLVAEDYSQRIATRHTLKLVSFTPKDQIMYLEGRLAAPERFEAQSNYWDLSKHFKAFLTPLPSTSQSKESAPNKERVRSQNLPMQYLYVYKSLDSKDANIYDSGNGHSNLLHTIDSCSSWFIGLYRQSNSLEIRGSIHSQRPSPYPFQANNIMYFFDKSNSNTKLLVKFLKDYNIRSTDTDDFMKYLFIQANFNGIMNVWRIKMDDLFTWLVEGDEN